MPSPRKRDPDNDQEQHDILRDSQVTVQAGQLLSRKIIIHKGDRGPLNISPGFLLFTFSALPYVWQKQAAVALHSEEPVLMEQANGIWI